MCVETIKINKQKKLYFTGDGFLIYIYRLDRFRL